MLLTQQRAEAYQAEREANKRSSISATIGYLIGKYIIWPLIQLFFRYFLSLAWLALIVFGYSRSIWLGLLATALFAGAIYWQPSRRFSFYGPFIKARETKLENQQIQAANDVLTEIGIGDGEAVYLAHAYDIDETTSVLELNQPIAGISSEQIMKRLDEHKDKFGFVRLARDPNSEAVLSVLCYLVDPLDEVHEITEPKPIDLNKASVPCAVDSFGVEQSVSMKGISGMTVSGVPGSGKTAGLTSFLLPFALSTDVDLAVIDGKGGDDWGTYSEIASYYNNDDENLVAILAYLQNQVAEMRERVATNKDKLGESNFWNASPEQRRSAGLKHKIIVIDECQTFFEKRTDKEENRLVTDIVRAVTTLVKKGRSAGYTVIVTTQKPTAESLPTSLRDNCGLKISFRVATGEARKAALGDIDLDESNDPVNIPMNQIGGAVMANENGAFTRVRFFYLSEKTQERIINDELHQRATSGS